MKWPKEVFHYGLHYVKVMEETPDKRKHLGYQCVNFPQLGTTRHLVSTWMPSKQYCQEVMGTIHYFMSQFVADYIRAYETLRIVGQSGQAEDFQVQPAAVDPYDPEAREWPSVLDHHGILYWKKTKDLGGGKITVAYECEEFPVLGTLKFQADTPNPSPKYKNAALVNVMQSINQYLTDYFIHIMNKRAELGKSDPLFDHSDVGITNQYEMAEAGER